MPDTALAPPWSPIRARPRITGPRFQRSAVPPAVLVALLIATLSGIALLVGPATGTDLAAQDARSAFASAHPTAAVDFRWYGGVLPAAYSVVAPYVEAVVGVRLAGVLAAIGGAGLLAALLVRWNVRRPIAASVWGALALVANVVSGRVAFGLGVALACAALAAVPPAGARWRRWIGCVALAIATSLTSPIAAAFLALVAMAWAATTRRRDVSVIAGSVVLANASVAVLFPEYGRMPLTWAVARPVLLVCVAVFMLCPLRAVRVGSALYAAATVVTYIVSNPVGSNIERLALLFAGLVLLAVSPVRTWLLVVAVAVVAQWSMRVTLTDLSQANALQAEHVAAQRLLPILDRLGTVTGRVEVVPFVDHGEAAIVAAHWPLARGWERQADTTRASVLYRRTLSPDAYIAWLRANSVQYVALSRHRHDWSTGPEIRVLSQPVAGLDVVYSDDEWTVWRVEGSRPFVDGGQLVAMTADRVTFSVAGMEPVTVAIRWSRWLTVSTGACIRPKDGRVLVVPRRPGVFTLSSSYLAPLDGRHC